MATEQTADPRRASSYQPSLDGLRAIAILMVIAYHDGVLKGGFLGVELFFVLSGYLITTLLQREYDASGSIRLGRFYARRLLRLAPALCLFVLVAWAVTHWLQPGLAGWLRGSWALAALLYVSNLLIAFGGQYPLGAVSICWSLALEEQFYLVWPAALRLLHRARVSRRGVILLLAGLAASCLLLRHVLLARHGDDPRLWIRVYFGPDTSAEGLIWGCLLAVVWRGMDPGRAARTGGAGVLLGAGVLAWLAIRLDIQDLVDRPILLSVAAVSSAALIHGAVTHRLVRRLLELPVLVWIGQLSYSLYLWHAFSIDLYRFEPRWRRYVFMLGAAAASHYLLERPVQGLARRFGAIARPHAWALRAADPGQASRASGSGTAGLACGAAGLVLVVSLGWVRLTGWGPAGLGLPPLVQARERVAQGELGRAVDLYERALANDPRDRAAEAELVVALVSAGSRALDEGRPQEAIGRFSRAASLRPDDAGIRNELGVALATSGRYDEAVTQFQASLALGAGAKVQENLARALRDRAQLAPRRDPGGPSSR